MRLTGLIPVTAAWLMHGSVALAEPPASVWNAGTAPTATAPAAEETHLKVRVYEGFEGHGIGSGTRDTPVTIDTDIEWVTCQAGNLEVSRMDIGGAPYESATDCAGEARRGTTRVDDGQQRDTTATAGPAVAPEVKPAPRCDPATWHCAEPAPLPPPPPAPR